MGTRKLQEKQRRAVDAILQHMKEYLDLRYQMALRANPRFESSWPDLQWLALQQMRNTLSGEKMWGPDRFVVGEVFVSNDDAKIRDLFSSTNQRSIMNEVVERKEDTGHKTADILEIHDFQSLYSAIDPNIANIAAVMQIYLWWDLPDAVELARFSFKAKRYKDLREDYSDQWAQFYAVVMGRDEEENPPAQDEVLNYEADRMRETVEAFCARRNGEPGYKLILAREVRHEDHEDNLIRRLARETLLLQTVEKGETPDETIQEQLAKAMQIEPTDLTQEMMQTYLTNLINEHKSRLRAVLTGSLGGETYNFKDSQAKLLVQRFRELVGDRQTQTEAESPPAEPAKAN